MANRYKQAGEFIDYTPGSAVAAGEVVVVTDRVFIAPRAIAANVLGELATCGVWTMDKTTGEAWTLGQTLYWNAAGAKVTTTASTHKIIGHAAAAAGSAATEGDVLLGTD